MKNFEGLNNKQNEAVLHTEGPLLVLAGAGSGKTRVLTVRIAHLIENKGVNPGNILAITFTNKAAKEMKERIGKLLGPYSTSIWVNTFHSMCIRILRRDIDRLGFDKNFVIFDTSDQQTVIKDCLKELNISDKNFQPKNVLEEIGRAKDELMSPAKYEKVRAVDFRTQKISQIYNLYQKKMKQNNAVDFDDIIIETINLFEKNSDILEYYQKKFKYILVDEYQDTNTAQYTLINMLADYYENLCVVGDDDQSIYGWRGANIRNILDFEQDYTKARVIKLEQNYRSTKSILNAANAVIKNNFGRKVKELWTDNHNGNKINFYRATSEREEAMYVSSRIQKQVRENNKNYKDVGILYRVNAQSRVIEEGLMREGIPYKIFGGLKFYDRKEIKDITAYLRLIQNPSDNISLKRIINVPKRGIGLTTVDNIEDMANEREMPIYSIITCSSEIMELKRSEQKLSKFIDLIEDFRIMKDKLKPSELIKYVIDNSGILKELKDENTLESQSRIENIEELISVALEYENENKEGLLEDFLAHISLVSDVDKYDENSDCVVLMTLHSAKGLEFPIVFLIGLEEGIFPSYRSTLTEDGVEEERRLCYVGITRAMEQLYMSNARSRMIFGSTSINPESRFLKEIPNELFNSDNPNPQKFQNNPNTINKINKSNSINSFGISADMYLKNIRKSSNNEDFSKGKDLKVGDKVSHKKFGNGVITSLEKEKDDVKVEIIFETFGMKRLMAEHAKLTKI